MTTPTNTVDVSAEERRLLDSIPVAILITDAAGRLAEANSTWRALSGLSRQRSLGDGWWAVIDAADHRRLHTDLARVLADGVDRTGDYRLAADPRPLRWRLRRRDGGDGPHLLVAVYAEQPAGSPSSTLAMADRIITDLFAIGLTFATAWVDDVHAARRDEAVELVDRLIHDLQASVFDAARTMPPATTDERPGARGNGQLVVAFAPDAAETSALLETPAAHTYSITDSGGSG